MRLRKLCYNLTLKYLSENDTINNQPAKGYPAMILAILSLFYDISHQIRTVGWFAIAHVYIF